MSDIKAVLLIPAEGDPHKLLGDPESATWKCGARPPIVYEAHAQSAFGPNITFWTTSEATASTSKKQAAYMPHRRALVLAWDGEPVDEVQPYIERTGIDYGLLAPFVTYALAGMDIGQGPWPGTLVLLQANPSIGLKSLPSCSLFCRRRRAGGE